VVILGEAQARASNTFAHYTRPVGDGVHLGGGLRYDRMRRWTDAPVDTRVFQTWTLNATVGLGEKVNLLLDYERRGVRAPDGAAATTRLLDTMGDRVSGELVVNF
jgi:hypothetical protein